MTGSSKRPILVVDDEPEILYSLRGLLRTEFEVYTAESGREALELLQRQPVHVVLTDQRMPEITGVELLSRVQGEWPNAIRMVFTGYSDIKAVIDAVNESRIFRYITKPWDPEELRVVLHQACDEYDRHNERKQLLADLNKQQAEWLAYLEEMRASPSGTLDPAAKARGEALAAAGRTLLERLDRVVE